MACADGGREASESTWRAGKEVPIPASTSGNTPTLSVSLHEDLAIEDPSQSLWTPRALAIANTGDVFVLDAAGKRVLCFGANGELKLEIGRPGQGPGELQRPVYVATAGRYIGVHDRARGNVITWTTSGQLLGEAPAGVPRVLNALFGTRGGEFVAGGRGIAVGRGSIEHVYQIVSWRPGADEATIIAQFPMPETSHVYRNGRRHNIFLKDQHVPMFIVGHTGQIIAAPSANYTVQALTSSGEPEYHIDAPFARAEFPANQVRLAARALARKGISPNPGEVAWPKRLPAIRKLRTDGEGNLFVFVNASPGDSGPRRRAHVFEQGRRWLGVADLASSAWDASGAGFAYAIRGSAADPEHKRVIRYRVSIEAVAGVAR